MFSKCSLEAQDKIKQMGNTFEVNEQPTLPNKQQIQQLIKLLDFNCLSHFPDSNWGFESFLAIFGAKNQLSKV